ncbi:thioredoxin family protein [Metamycoplasma hyosynoviae]|uniref:thioredoxin family protein n=1 Tax=Metamycoplasma hyosynoviae TaxID=29559 RepID=UPI00049EB38D|nr:thioredoxin family protein [Metamycoplasma hyosynoviae]KDE44562.1 thioredoxin [Metamycoplasma hyosynoviae]
MLERITQQELKDRHLTGKAIIAFRATWCPPCRMIGPELEKLAQRYPDINVFDFDVDKNIDFAREMNVNRIPTLFYYKDGKLVNSTSGYMPMEELIKKFK